MRSVRQLMPEARDLDDGELIDLYDWPEDCSRPWVRGLMAMTLDGTFVGPDGVSGSVSGRADSQVFSASRALADVFLVGAQTVRAEGYKAVRARPELAERRAARGQRPAPVLAVVSATCRFDWPDAEWRSSDEQPMVITPSGSDPALRQIASESGVEVLVTGDDVVRPGDIVALLAERGLVRVNCEGGPSLLGEIIAADLVDELALTLSPLTTHAHVPRMGERVVRNRMRLEHLLESDGYLFTRYVRDRAATA